jgi:pseudouridine synthase
VIGASKARAIARSEAQRRIRAGEVTVNGRLVLDPLAPVHAERDRIAIAGASAEARPWRTIAFHKPRGIVTTRSDPQGRRTVFDLLGDAGEGLVAVGRLDLASSGLLLLTTDTQLAERLTNSANAIVRRYAVTARGFVSDDDCARMERGLDDLRAAAVRVRKRSRRETHLIIDLTEEESRPPPPVRRRFRTSVDASRCCVLTAPARTPAARRMARRGGLRAHELRVFPSLIGRSSVPTRNHR